MKRAFKIVPDLAPIDEGDIKPGIKLAYIDIENDAEELSGWSGSSLVARRGRDLPALMPLAWKQARTVAASVGQATA